MHISDESEENQGVPAQFLTCSACRTGQECRAVMRSCHVYIPCHTADHVMVDGPAGLRPSAASDCQTLVLLL